MSNNPKLLDSECTLMLRADLIEAAATLRRYETQHRAKGTAESTVKAEVNAALANRFEATIDKTTNLAQPADMFWNHDDAERSHDSLDELLNDELCNGTLEVGAVFTIQRAISLPNIKILVTAIDDNECEAQYEVIADELSKDGAA